MSFFFQAEDGIRDLVRSRGLGDVYKRQVFERSTVSSVAFTFSGSGLSSTKNRGPTRLSLGSCLLYTSDAADERSSVDLGGRRIIKKTNELVQVADSYITK